MKNALIAFNMTDSDNDGYVSNVVYSTVIHVIQ